MMDPVLGSLANNGGPTFATVAGTVGPTFTRALGGGSPAINAGSAAAPALDQCGNPRVGAPDIGSVEHP